MSLLNNDTPILISTTLAMNIGLNEALMLQQLNDLVQTAGSVREGEKWISKTLMEFHQQFPFWSKSTIDRILKKLEQLNLIEVGNFNERKTDRTKWYRINEEEVKKISHHGFSQNDELKNSPQKIDEMDTSISKKGLCQNDELDTSTCRFPSRQYGGMGHVKMTGAIPIDYTENTIKDYIRERAYPPRRMASNILKLIKVKFEMTKVLLGRIRNCCDFEFMTTEFVT
ncbi:DNA-binding PadR family transcriptional regulator [Lysinibacillus composti]|uniref:Transcriptional regulator n=1 Tax=Lysinibacillus composti TaxID=720633 RepID=A0A3N9UB58_9BACI|nr:helix-turn-helix domain-containing protein [Lysinibacillus composti]MBM7609749.1 DNA-binding PadR family transcriptional regulator [Lysinibacillus composti]RQW73668.1 transcriptional regulator [Lysinibacillus composti]